MGLDLGLVELKKLQRAHPCVHTRLLLRSVSACVQAWSSKGRVGMSKRATSGESIDPSSDSSTPGSPSPRLDQRHHSVKQSVPAHGSAYPSEVQLQQACAYPSPLYYPVVLYPPY